LNIRTPLQGIKIVKTLVAGWFSFEQGGATAGDLMAADLACEWLEEARNPYDIALAPPWEGGVNWRQVNPQHYAKVLFVCGPFRQYHNETEFLKHFEGCQMIGLNLTMPTPLHEWNPFDLLFERDSSVTAHPDLSFLARQPKVPVVGICLVEPYFVWPPAPALTAIANEAIQRLVASREIAAVLIDTRLDSNSTGLRTPTEVESLIARMDVMITTRLHGMVLALKNGVPVIAIDPEPGGAKICRQAETIDWPIVFAADALTEEGLQKAFDYCLTERARVKALACSQQSAHRVQAVRERFITAFADPDGDHNAVVPIDQGRESAWHSKFLTAARLSLNLEAYPPAYKPTTSAQINKHTELVMIAKKLLKPLAQLTMPSSMGDFLNNKSSHHVKE
jgi:Polysaccharide pyruvyl transferase